MTSITASAQPAVIIPSLNPDHNLEQLVSKLIQAGTVQIIIVDDGSGPQYQPIFQRLSTVPSCEVLHHPVNLGKGKALKTAFAYFLAQPEYAPSCGVVTADADGQHRPEDILRTCAALQAHPSNLVLGVRDFSQEQVPPKSKYGNSITKKVFHLLYGKQLSDTQTGLRGIPRTWLPTCLEIPGDRFEYETKMLIEAATQNVPIEEVPIETVYIDSNRETHFRPVVDSLKIYGLFFRYLLSSLVTSIVDYLVFSLAFYLYHSLALSTILGRFFAIFVYYFVQKRFVFRKKDAGSAEFIKLVLLVIFSGTCSFLLLEWITRKVPSTVFFLKILVEVILYFMNFLIQRNFVWRSRKPLKR